MSRELRLPFELDTFIGRPGPLTMVVRGPPGSGKTTLALAMLEAFYGQKMFVTGRRSKPGILADFPWLGSVEGHGIEVVDAVIVGEAGDSDAPVRSPASGLSEDSALTSVIDSLPPPFRKAWGRRGSAERDLARDFAWMPKGMRSALLHATSGDRAMIVVDSWDAFIDECLDLTPSGTGTRLNREELERTALRLIARGAAHLVLVLERSEATQLDYLVDGIIRTTHEIHDAHPERWISMPKLRGIRIENESYPYTLEGGKFKCISPEPVDFDHPVVFVEPDPAPVPGTVWPGSQSFAEAFGRLREGELTTIELDSRVSDWGVETITFPMMASVVALGGRVLYEPAPAQRLVDLWSTFASQFSPVQFQRLVRIIAPGATLPESNPLRPCLLTVPRTIGAASVGAPVQTPVPQAREFVTTASAEGVVNLALISGDSLRLITGLTGAEDTPESLALTLKSYMVGSPTHVIFVGRTGDPLLEGVRRLTSIQLTLRNRLGRTFVYGERPVSPTYSLSPRMKDEQRAYGLLRLV